MDVARKLVVTGPTMLRRVVGTSTLNAPSLQRQLHDSTSTDAMVSLYGCSPTPSTCVDLTAAGKDEGTSDAYRSASNVNLRSATLSSVPDPYVGRAAYDDDVTVPPSESQPVNRWASVTCQLHDVVSRTSGHIDWKSD